MGVTLFADKIIRWGMGQATAVYKIDSQNIKRLPIWAN